MDLFLVNLVRELGVSSLYIPSNIAFLISVEFYTESFRYFPDSQNI